MFIIAGLVTRLVTGFVIGLVTGLILSVINAGTAGAARTIVRFGMATTAGSGCVRGPMQTAGARRREVVQMHRCYFSNGRLQGFGNPQRPALLARAPLPLAREFGGAGGLVEAVLALHLMQISFITSVRPRPVVSLVFRRRTGNLAQLGVGV